MPRLPHGIRLPAGPQRSGQGHGRGEGERVVQRGAAPQQLAEPAGTGEPTEQVEEKAAQSSEVEPPPWLARTRPGHRSWRLEGTEAGAGQTQGVGQHHRGVQVAVGQTPGSERIERWGQRLGHRHHVLGTRGRFQLDQERIARLLPHDINPAVGQLTCIFHRHDGRVRRMDQGPSLIQAARQGPGVGNVRRVQKTKHAGALIRATHQEGVGHSAATQPALHLPGAGGPTL